MKKRLKKIICAFIGLTLAKTYAPENTIWQLNDCIRWLSTIDHVNQTFCALETKAISNGQLMNGNEKNSINSVLEYKIKMDHFVENSIVLSGGDISHVDLGAIKEYFIHFKKNFYQELCKELKIIFNEYREKDFFRGLQYFNYKPVLIILTILNSLSDIDDQDKIGLSHQICAPRLQILSELHKKNRLSLLEKLINIVPNLLSYANDNIENTNIEKQLPMRLSQLESQINDNCSEDIKQYLIDFKKQNGKEEDFLNFLRYVYDKNCKKYEDYTSILKFIREKYFQNTRFLSTYIEFLNNKLNSLEFIIRWDNNLDLKNFFSSDARAKNTVTEQEQTKEYKITPIAIPGEGTLTVKKGQIQWSSHGNAVIPKNTEKKEIVLTNDQIKPIKGNTTKLLSYVWENKRIRKLLQEVKNKNFDNFKSYFANLMKCGKNMGWMNLVNSIVLDSQISQISQIDGNRIACIIGERAIKIKKEFDDNKSSIDDDIVAIFDSDYRLISDFLCKISQPSFDFYPQSEATNLKVSDIQNDSKDPSSERDTFPLTIMSNGNDQLISDTKDNRSWNLEMTEEFWGDGPEDKVFSISQRDVCSDHRKKPSILEIR
jgi:hypothetical protein